MNHSNRGFEDDLNIKSGDDFGDIDVEPSWYDNSVILGVSENGVYRKNTTK